ncbi:MAG: lysophospholipid acyltransferase family protein [Candidatus Yanofskybacteria bacterium]|nr:lysophospholipid acyltransferase family protein [Candidatus Yanofskybacteria bacterium]
MFQATGLVRVEGQRHLRGLLSQNKGFLVMHRHPSMRETVIIPLLFFPSFLWNPWRVPLSAPDERNYYRPWWCAFLRPAAIPVPRGNRDGEIRALRKMHRALKEGRRLVLAPEGGRTFKGEEFKYLLSSGDTRVLPAPDGGVDLSLAVIRRFKGGVQILCNNGTPILPVWVDSTRWRTRIVFGKPEVIPQGENTLEALEDMLLRTAPRLH